MPLKPRPSPARDVGIVVVVRRAVAHRERRELGGLVVVVTEDGTRAIVENRARIAARLQRTDPGVAWWLNGETCAPGECLALVAVDGVRQVVRVRLDDPGEAEERESP
jgi:hypothetical protein